MLNLHTGNLPIESLSEYFQPVRLAEMNIQFATTNLLITQPPMFIGTTLKERRAILRTVFEATANFSISKKKKKKSNNPVKQTTPKTGILHEPTTQGRRSQRRNKKKKKERVARESFPRSANDISHLRSHGPVPLELQIYLVPRFFSFFTPPLPPPSPNKRTSRGLARL